jgi:hypothetical protein
MRTDIQTDGNNYVFLKLARLKASRTERGVCLSVDNGGKRYRFSSSAALYLVFQLLQNTWLSEY